MKNNSETILGEISIDPPLSQKENEFLLLFFDKLHNVSNEVLDLNKHLYAIKTENVKADNLIPEKETSSILDLESEWFDYLFGEKETILTPSYYCPITIDNDNIRLKKKAPLKDKVAEWIVFSIEHFFKTNSIAKTLYPEEFYFLKEHNLNGIIYIKNSAISVIQEINIQNNIVRICVSDYKNHSQYNKNDAKLPVKDLFKYKNLVKNEILSFPQSDFLNKLILNAQLEKDLEFKTGIPKKTKL